MHTKAIEPESRKLKESDFWIFWHLWFQDEWYPDSAEDYLDVATLTALGYLWADGNDPEEGLVVGLTDKARDLLKGMLSFAVSHSEEKLK